MTDPSTTTVTALPPIVSREEWDVCVDGRLFRLVRDRLREEWLLDGEFD